MKIYELTGFKSNPAFKAAQNFDIDQDANLQIGNKSRTDLRSKLAALGWKPAGHGNFSEVFQNPSYDYVLKIFSSSDHRYMKFFQYVKQNQNNPHVPKIRGSTVKLSPTAYAARIERLSPVHDHDPLLLKYVDPLLIDQYHEEAQEWESPLEWILASDENQDFLKRKWPKLYQLARDLWNLVGKDNGDFDGYQFMARGDTIVWIDP
jgi:hypothetical protein